MSFYWTKPPLNTGQIRPVLAAWSDSPQGADAVGSFVPDFAVLVTAFLVVSALAPTTVGSLSAPFPSRMPWTSDLAIT